MGDKKEADLAEASAEAEAEAEAEADSDSESDMDVYLAESVAPDHHPDTARQADLQSNTGKEWPSTSPPERSAASAAAGFRGK